MNVQPAPKKFQHSWDFPTAIPVVKFGPRRLAHANIFVRDLDPSMAFYGKVCGFREVAREPGLHAGFLTNGNTHHDLGIVQCLKGDRDMHGRGGHLQMPKWRGHAPGLNHFGWEMENEKLLVAAFERAAAAGFPIHRTTDHQVSHSVYVFDPDGNQHEIYADAEKQWWKILRGGDIELISGEWTPGDPPATTEAKYHENPAIVRVEEAPFHPDRIARGTLLTPNFDPMRRFFRDLVGLEEIYVAPKGNFVCFRGTASEYDLALFQSSGAKGMHHCSFELANEDDFANSGAKLKAAGVKIEFEVDNAAKKAVFLKDPSGTYVELCHPRKLDFAIAAKADPAQQVFLV
jgi:catechol 2,3-dioxygenase